MRPLNFIDRQCIFEDSIFEIVEWNVRDFQCSRDRSWLSLSRRTRTDKNITVKIYKNQAKSSRCTLDPGRRWSEMYRRFRNLFRRSDRIAGGSRQDKWSELCEKSVWNIESIAKSRSVVALQHFSFLYGSIVTAVTIAGNQCADRCSKCSHYRSTPSSHSLIRSAR